MIKNLIQQAEHNLLSPQQFHYLCQQEKQLNKYQRLYFIKLKSKQLESGINLKPFCHFLDYLASKIRQRSLKYYNTEFDLQPVCIYSVRVKKFIKLLKKKTAKTHISSSLSHKITVEIIGQGMIGRVAKLTINNQQCFAFKTYFYPNYVWNHGPWGEIPVGIYLKAHQVTKDFAEFEFSGQDWTVWEWIEPEIKPELRSGIYYQDFAQKYQLTRLNPLNYRNYNPYLIRLDAGGVQKEYPGRYFWDFVYGLNFYLIKIRQEGIFSLLIYLNWTNLNYSIKRVLSLVSFVFNKPIFGFTKNQKFSTNFRKYLKPR
jgi:hypothetical protein